MGPTGAVLNRSQDPQAEKQRKRIDLRKRRTSCAVDGEAERRYDGHEDERRCEPPPSRVENDCPLEFWGYGGAGELHSRPAQHATRLSDHPFRYRGLSVGGPHRGADRGFRDTPSRPAARAKRIASRAVHLRLPEPMLARPGGAFSLASQTGSDEPVEV